jgi:hypothetical protein
VAGSKAALDTPSEQSQQPPAVANAADAIADADAATPAAGAPGNGTAAQDQQPRASQRQQPADAAAAAAGGIAAPSGVLLGAVRPGERYAFCMTNPPFFETIQQAGLNPHTAHLGAHRQPAVELLDTQLPS